MNAPRAASPQRLGPLEQDASCSNRTHWCTSVAGGEGRAGAVERSLEGGGWQLRCRHPRLRVFRRQSGHEIAWVLPSGRVQIRVPLLVDHGEREASARAVWRELQRAFEE